MGGVVDPVRGKGLAERPEEVEGSVLGGCGSAGGLNRGGMRAKRVRDEPALVEADVVAREGPAVVARVEMVAQGQNAPDEWVIHSVRCIASAAV